MNCSECQTLLAEYALDLIDEATALEIASHLAEGCGVCRRSLIEHQATWHALADELTPIEAPPELKRRLMEKIGSGPKHPSSLPPSSPDVPDRSVDRRLRRGRGVFAVAIPYIAATVAGIVAGIWYQFSAIQDGERRLADSVAPYQQHIDQQRRDFGQGKFQLASLQPAADNGAIQGHYLWDATAQQIHVYVANLADDARQDLRLWFVTADNRWIPSAILQRQSNHYWTAVCDIPPTTSPEPSAALARLAIVEHDRSATGEDRASETKPPGKVRLEGAIP